MTDGDIAMGFETGATGDAARSAAYARLTECWLAEIDRRGTVPGLSGT